MTIELHNISCDACVLDKTSYLTQNPASITAYFKIAETDILFPILITDNALTLNAFNYVYISDLNAYYFVTNRKILDNNRYQINLEKDVLFSNLAKIKASSCILKRSYTNGKTSFADETDAFEEKERFDFISLATYKISEFNNDGYDYLLVYYDGFMNDTAAHPESSLVTNIVNTYDDGIEPNINASPYILGYQNNTNYRILDAQQLLLLARAVGNDSNKLSMIKGIYKIPMHTSTSSELLYRVIITSYTKINLGTETIDLNYDNTHTLMAPYSFRSRWVFEDFTLYTISNYQNYYYLNPFSKYEIWCAFVGWVEIPSANLINKHIKIFYTFNLENGESTCNFYDVGSKTIFMTRNANVLLPISLSAINMREMEERKTALTLNTIIGGASSVVSMVGGAYTGNVMAFASGVISAGKVASNAITGFTQLHPSGNVQLQNTNSSYQARLDFVLKRTYKQIQRIVDTKLGRPCNSYLPISQETGYFEGVNFILSDNSGLCKDEIEKIKILIEKGVYAS